MEFGRRIIPEVEGLLLEVVALRDKKDISWADVIALEKSALNFWSVPELRDGIHHEFTNVLAELREVDPGHEIAVEAIIALHNIVMHPNTAHGLIDVLVNQSPNSGLVGNLTHQDIELLLDIVVSN